MSTPAGRAPINREKRLHTLSAYLGETSALLREYARGEEEVNVDQRIRTFSHGKPDDLLVALEVLSAIPDAITVIHGPRGCAVSQLQRALLARGRAFGRWTVTDLDQKATIMGADAKLRAAVAAFYHRYGPKVVFIVATPAVAINNDDIQSVVDELSGELGTIIIPIYASGFTSKTSVYGYDLVAHSLVKTLVKNPPAERGAWVNLLSLAESSGDRDEARRLLQALGLETLTLPDGAGVQDFAKAAGARFSVPLDFDAGHYLGRAFQDVAQVPLLDVPRPIGLVGTREWLLTVGAAAGKQSEARDFHAREAAALAEILEAQPLRGAKVYLSLAPATALGVLNLVKETGGHVAGLTVSHVDQLHLDGLRKFQDQSPALQIHVGEGQGFEEANLLQRLKPDLYVGDGGQLVQAARLGIPSVFLPRIPVVGYRGVRAFARRTALALKNRAFVARFAGGPQLFADNWFQRSAHWHIKQEVK